MKSMTRNTLLALVSTLVSLPVLAGNHQYQDQARVLSATPQIERVNNPIRTCETEYVRERTYDNRSNRRSNTGAVLGGVTGGLLGSTIGKGNGRVAAAVVGAGLGAIVGDRMDNNRRYQNVSRSRGDVRPVETCYMRDRWSDVTTGYVVDYEYQGRRYSTVTDSEPGRYISVDVNVRPRRGEVTEVSYAPQVRRYHRGHKHNKFKNRLSRGATNGYDHRRYW